MALYSLVVVSDFENQPLFAIFAGDLSKFDGKYVGGVDTDTEENEILQNELCDLLFDAESGRMYEWFDTNIPLAKIVEITNGGGTIIQVNTGYIP